jgi:NitT/TauT family transport system substrate-binding protein
MLKLILCVVSALAISAPAATAALAQTPVRLVLDYAIQGQQSPILLAAEGGYFERAGVSVTVDRGYGSGDSITKVASGAYDMAFADVGALITFNSQQGAAKLIDVFQVYQVAPMVILSLKTSGIAKPTDLAGKTIASPPTASSRVMFPPFAALNKIDTSAIKWVNVTPQLREVMLRQGQADATTALITDVAGLEKLNISKDELSIMRFSDYHLDLYGHAILTTPEFASKNPEILKKIVEGIAAAWKDTIIHPDVAIAALKRHDSMIDERVERQRLDLVIANAIVTDNVKSAGLGAVDMDRMQKTIDLISATLGRPPMKSHELYDGSYLPARGELMLPH